MPVIVELEVLPNQRVEIVLERRRYSITIQQTNELVCATITRDEETVVSGMRCLPRSPLFPYKYQEDASGNFMFTTLLDNLPTYEEFGKSVFLWYFTDAEMVEARGG